MQYITKVVYKKPIGLRCELKVGVGFYFATPRNFFMLDGLDVQALRRQAGAGSKRFRKFPVTGPFDLPPGEAEEFAERYTALCKQGGMSLVLGPWDEPSRLLVVPSYVLPPAPYTQGPHPSEGEEYTRVNLYVETEALYILTTCYPGSPEWSPIHVILKPRYRAAAKAANDGYKPKYTVRLSTKYASGSINPCFAPKRPHPSYVALSNWPVSDEGHKPIDVLSYVAKFIYDQQQPVSACAAKSTVLAPPPPAEKAGAPDAPRVTIEMKDKRIELYRKGQIAHLKEEILSNEHYLRQHPSEKEYISGEITRLMEELTKLEEG